LNQRRRKPAILQTAPFSHSGTPPAPPNRNWSRKWDSNPRPLAYKARALPLSYSGRPGTLGSITRATDQLNHGAACRRVPPRSPRLTLEETSSNSTAVERRTGQESRLPGTFTHAKPCHTGPKNKGHAPQNHPDDRVRTVQDASASFSEASEARAPDRLDRAHAAVEAVLQAVERVMVGKRLAAERILCALLAGGHVLIDDVPGVGKTMMVKTLAYALSLRFSRVQFTPDLLPSDLLGVNIWDPGTRAFNFHPGPIFTHLLLADEINRTSPRTQSALLEAMEEGQVTVDGATHLLEPPFMVVATENPLEYEGTFPLPEAELDRFLFRLELGYPSPEDEQALLARVVHNHPLETVRPVLDRTRVLQLREAVRQVYVAPALMAYLTALVQRTRAHPRLALGASPRAGIAWMHAAQAWAFMHGRQYVVPDDLRALAADALVHRLLARGAYGSDGEAVAREALEEILAETPLPREGRA
jgi:MoxR-like ATPase